jgi:hypothetical protein
MVRAPISAMPKTVKTAFRMPVSIARAPLKTIASRLFAARLNYGNSKDLDRAGGCRIRFGGYEAAWRNLSSPRSGQGACHAGSSINVSSHLTMFGKRSSGISLTRQ